MPYLFSYGTFQQEEVQLSTFGRRLNGTPDNLVGFIIAQLKITHPDVLAKSGKEFHPIARATQKGNNRVPGTVFEVSDEELKHSDRYEVDHYKRIETILESGKSAWVYVEAMET